MRAGGTDRHTIKISAFCDTANARKKHLKLENDNDDTDDYKNSS
jgi:hypothetical protein